MNRPCKGNLPRLVALMDGSLRPGASDRLRRHLDGCPGCSEAYGRLMKTRRLLRELDHEEPPELPWRQLEAQVRWKLAQEQKGERGRSRLPALVALAAGAAVVGAVAAVVVMSQMRPPAVAPVEAPVARSTEAAVETRPLDDVELAAIATMVRGDVHVLTSRGQMEPLEFDRPLLQGTSVITGAGQAALQWSEGSGLLVTRHATLVLQRMRTRSQELGLQRGRVLVRMAPLAPAQRFSIVAGGIRTTVVGTYFSVELDPEAVEVEVYKGVVRVEPVDERWSGLEIPAEHRVRVALDSKHPPRVLPLHRRGPSSSVVHLVRWPSLQRVMATTGSLTVASRPAGADLMLDARPVGMTDVKLRGAMGPHELQLWKGGKLLETRWVEVKPRPGLVAMDIREHLMKLRPRYGRLPLTIYQYIRHRRPQIRACYERWLKRFPDAEGKLVFRIRVEADGSISKVSLQRDTFKQPQVGQCALNKITRWHLPEGKATELVYPFTFRRPAPPRPE
jgi:ferric-dicitrate binding protein FerR (iron transport regulator)